MPPLGELAPDQRAVVNLILRQGRSYADIAALLELPEGSVRARAHAGLAALAPPSALPGEITEPLADWLLGQQEEHDAAATRALLDESAPARAWADGVAARLEGVGNGLPSATAAPPPADPAAPEANPATAPAADPAAAPAADDGGPAADAAEEVGPASAPERPPASRLGGALLILGVLAAVGIVAFLVLRGGDDAPEEDAAVPAATATATATPAASPQVTDRIALRATGGGEAGGRMTVYLQDGQLQFALEATNVPRSAADSAYGVWFTGPGDRAVRLGFTAPVGADGRLGIAGPSARGAAAFPQQYATYRRVVVSRETTSDTRRPGPIILTGTLPAGR